MLFASATGTRIDRTTRIARIFLTNRKIVETDWTQTSERILGAFRAIAVCTTRPPEPIRWTGASFTNPKPVVNRESGSID